MPPAEVDYQKNKKLIFLKKNFYLTDLKKHAIMQIK